MAFQMSSLQGEKPTVSTLLRANVLCRELKATKDFELVFRPVNPLAGGVMVVTDSSLGNVTVTGSAGATPLEKVFSQSCYYVLLADEELMRGRPGSFNVLDMRSHRIPRVCRSSYAAETLGAEEAFDVGQLCRGFMASWSFAAAAGRLNSVGLTVVVDAKDVHGKANSDTSSFGSQKSLAFTVAWLRADSSTFQHHLQVDFNGEYVGRRRNQRDGPDSPEEDPCCWALVSGVQPALPQAGVEGEVKTVYHAGYLQDSWRALGWERARDGPPSSTRGTSWLAPGRRHGSQRYLRRSELPNTGTSFCCG